MMRAQLLACIRLVNIFFNIPVLPVLELLNERTFPFEVQIILDMLRRTHFLD